MTGAGGVGGLLSTTYQGVTYQVCRDANGNVTGLVPVSGTGAGVLVARCDYDPFGNRVANAGPSVELCPFGFSSKYWNSGLNILSYELRWYSPLLGSWLSQDPLFEIEGQLPEFLPEGPKSQKFIGNDPVNLWDYLGLIAGGRGNAPNPPGQHSPRRGGPGASGDPPRPFYPYPDPIGFALCSRNLDTKTLPEVLTLIAFKVIYPGNPTDHTYLHYKECKKMQDTRSWNWGNGSRSYSYCREKI